MSFSSLNLTEAASQRRAKNVATLGPASNTDQVIRDMIRAGVSLPALQRLMGHAYIHTTLVYIHLTPQDVFAEYARAVERRLKPAPPKLP